MSDFSVFDVQKALKMHADAGHDVTKHPHETIIGENPYRMRVNAALTVFSPKTVWHGGHRGIHSYMVSHHTLSESPLATEVVSTLHTDGENKKRTYNSVLVNPMLPYSPSKMESGDHYNILSPHAMDDPNDIAHLMHQHSEEDNDNYVLHQHTDWDREPQQVSRGEALHRLHSTIDSHAAADLSSLKLPSMYTTQKVNLPKALESIMPGNHWIGKSTGYKPYSGHVFVQHYNPDTGKTGVALKVSSYLYDPQSEQLHPINRSINQ